MKCPECEHVNPDGTKFCVSCGTPLGEVTRAMPQVPGAPTAPQPTTPMPAVQVPAYVPQQIEKKRDSRTILLVVLGVVGVLLVAGAVVTVVMMVAAANRPVARITSAELVRTDDTTLDTSEVPLDTELAFRVTYNAKFKGTGSGTLRLEIVDSADDTVMDETFVVKSSGKAQTKKLTFTMEQGSGKPLEARALLTVKQGEKKLTASKDLSFTMVAGKGKDLQLGEAVEAATQKCDEATAALDDAVAAGIDVGDLLDRLSAALEDLEEAETAAEADAVAGTAQGVIDECAARKAAAAEEARTAEICRQNQRVVYDRLVDWWGGSGNFPNDMSEMYGLPVCPSGGAYSYYAPSTDPSTLHVTCTVHGEL